MTQTPAGEQSALLSQTCGSLAEDPSQLERMPTPLALWDGARTHCLINTSTCRLTGFSQAELAANPQLWQQKIHHEDFLAFRDFVKRAALATGELVCDYRFSSSHDSKSIWLRETLSPLPDNCQPWRFISSYCDISDLKNCPDEMPQEASGQEQDKQIRSMFHEIKNRLQRLSMEIELAVLESQLAPEVSHKFTDALHAVNQSLTTMHDQLLGVKSHFPSD